MSSKVGEHPVLEPPREAGDGIESSARLILDVAKAAGAHLELADVLEALTTALKPRICFDAIGVSVIDGEYIRLHSLHVEGVKRAPGESIESIVARAAQALNLPSSAPPQPNLLKNHPLSEYPRSHAPRVAGDLQAEKRFPSEDQLVAYGIRSYIALPLLRRGRLIGGVHFLSLETRTYLPAELQLLQDVAEIISIAVSNALAYEEISELKDRLQTENRLLQDEIVQRSIFEEIVGSSRSLGTVLSAIDKVALTDSTVLITGETGTGKELVAHAIHRRSARSGRALVKVNCAALPSELIASELFGHEKGAFTGALQRRIGRFEAAHGGTIFLDEIGELPAEIQIALLRVLQEREFERVGDNRTIRTDVRVIAATNRDLEGQVKAGRFRMDLYYRLNVFPVPVPPLRERPDDIPILVDYFIARFAQRMGKRIRSIDRRTLQALETYAWPGNIRELQNVIERGVILAEDDVFRLERDTFAQAALARPVPAAPEPSSFPRDARREEIEAVLQETRGRVSGPEGAAARLGIPASTLESRIRALKINKHRFRGNS